LIEPAAETLPILGDETGHEAGSDDGAYQQ